MSNRLSRFLLVVFAIVAGILAVVGVLVVVSTGVLLPVATTVVDCCYFQLRELSQFVTYLDGEIMCLNSKQFSVGKLQAKLNKAAIVENSNSAPVLNGPTAASSKEEENLNGKLSDNPAADESSISAFMTLLCVGLYCLH
ncbi:hypothetical protein RIF29_28772 [Crotalaria pallida]|uniref:Uncharacterized protein n=1 Tax=Crotalaria pallida TaxID=3830 RepID=A0AAN9EJZ3_CROPI